MSQTQTIQKTYIWDPTTKQATRPLAMFDNNNKTLSDARLSDANFRDARFDVMLDNSQNIHYYTHDANKNVTELISDSGAISAHYEYSPFGATIASSGDLSYSNPFQFSSEFSDRPLGLIYYNYRHYNPLSGRWINRDPIEEKGGLNLYGFVYNNVNKYTEILGKSFISCMSDCITDNIGYLWGTLIAQLAAEGVLSIPFTKTGLIEFAKSINLPNTMIDKIMLGLQEGSVNKTTGIRVVSLMIRTLFKEFGLTSPIAAQFAKNFSNKIPKHLFIAAGLIIGTIDLYCCQTCCILAWYKLPYSEEYNMKDMITAGLEDLF